MSIARHVSKSLRHAIEPNLLVKLDLLIVLLDSFLGVFLLAVDTLGILLQDFDFVVEQAVICNEASSICTMHAYNEAYERIHAVSDCTESEIRKSMSQSRSIETGRHRQRELISSTDALRISSPMELVISSSNIAVSEAIAIYTIHHHRVSAATLHNAR